jgi:hypothetical protein
MKWLSFWLYFRFPVALFIVIVFALGWRFNSKAPAEIAVAIAFMCLWAQLVFGMRKRKSWAIPLARVVLLLDALIFAVAFGVAETAGWTQPFWPGLSVGILLSTLWIIPNALFLSEIKQQYSK